MELLELLQLINNIGSLQTLMTDARTGFEYLGQGIEHLGQDIDFETVQMAGRLGLTRLIVDEGDSSLYMVIDLEAVKTRLDNLIP